MMKYLMVLLSLFSGSVLGMGRVNELCGIDSVKTFSLKSSKEDVGASKIRG